MQFNEGLLFERLLGFDRGHSEQQHGRRRLRELAGNLDCPVLVISGKLDKVTPPRDARALARLAGGKLETITNDGHFPHARKPVQVNLALRDFSEDAFGRERTPRDPTVYRPDGRPRALFVSSPIGLGHAQRDVAIARELRRSHPDLQIDWLAQDGFLPMDDGDARESFLAADYNAQKVEHIAQHPEVCDLALFVGNPDDIVAERLGPQLPMIRDWTERHFDFTGYVTPPGQPNASLSCSRRQ